MQSSEIQNDAVEAQIKMSLLSPQIPKIYANGFICGQTLSDAFVVLQLNGQHISVLNLSLPAAKSLMTDLRQLISDYERDTNTEVLTIADIKSRIDK